MPNQADHRELQTAVADMASAFEQFKQYNDETLNQKADKEYADSLVQDAQQKADQAVQDAIARVEKLEREKTALQAAVQRGAGVVGGDVSSLDPEEKARVFALHMGRDDGLNPETVESYRKAMPNYLRRGEAMDAESHKAMQVGRDADGGYWVEPDTTGRIVQRVFESSPVRQVASVQTISTDALTGPLDLDEIDFGWVGEIQQRQTTGTAQVGEWRIPVHESYAFPLITQKLLDDSAIDVEAWLTRKISRRFARAESAAFVLGDGVKRPRGFLTYPDGVPTDQDWEQIERFQSGVNGAFPAADPASDLLPGDVLVDAMYGLKEEYRGNAIWSMNRRTEGETRKLKDGQGNYIWNPDLTQRNGRQILGAGVINFEDMPDLATNSLSIAIADWEEAYQIVERIGIRVLRDPYTRKPFVGFYATRRVGGAVINTEAIKLVEFAA